ncbi:MAG: IS4 family transposase [Phycisphaeraceae bacterium]
MEGTLALADRERWAQAQFSAADLGDHRRTRRLVKLAAMMAGNTSGSIPQQTGGGADMKAAYRLFDAQGVTHTAVCQPHFDQTRLAAGQVPMVFLLQDTTVLNFTTHRVCQGLGPIGEGGTLRGLHQPNVLAADPATRRPLGLMYQRHHLRTDRPKGSHADRSGRRAVPLAERESYWWIAAIGSIGKPPAGVQWVHVGDRGEDLLGVYDQARQQGTDWLIRVCQDRRILTPTGEDRLLPYARSLPARIRQTITIRRRPAGVPQEVTVCVSGGAVQLRPSRNEPCYRTSAPVSCWMVRVWEENPPAGSAPLEWVLCTSMDCTSDRMLGFAAQGYGLRWMFEEFHKCEKTGCQ